MLDCEKVVSDLIIEVDEEDFIYRCLLRHPKQISSVLEQMTLPWTDISGLNSEKRAARDFRVLCTVMFYPLPGGTSTPFLIQTKEKDLQEYNNLKFETQKKARIYMNEILKEKGWLVEEED